MITTVALLVLLNTRVSFSSRLAEEAGGTRADATFAAVHSYFAYRNRAS